MRCERSTMISKVEDLTGQVFGYLKVIERAPDSISKGGHKKVCWLCDCQLCGNNKIATAQGLKRGTTKSCGCYRSKKGAEARNKKNCVICGKEFECPPSDKTNTCSKECRKENARRRSTGRVFNNSVKQKLSKKAKGRDMTELQVLAVSAAMISPKSGKFETNINAMDWHIISPGGKHYEFHSLHHWLRENGRELFGCEPDSVEFKRVCSGLSGAKRAMLGKTANCCTYKDWRVIPTDDDYTK